LLACIKYRYCQILGIFKTKKVKGLYASVTIKVTLNILKTDLGNILEFKVVIQ